MKHADIHLPYFKQGDDLSHHLEHCATGENRVTASFLAVLRSLSLDRIQRLLGALLEQSEFEPIRFDNQPLKGGPIRRSRTG